LLTWSDLATLICKFWDTVPIFGPARVRLFRVGAQVHYGKYWPVADKLPQIMDVLQPAKIRIHPNLVLGVSTAVCIS